MILAVIVIAVMLLGVYKVMELDSPTTRPLARTATHTVLPIARDLAGTSAQWSRPGARRIPDHPAVPAR